MAINNNNSQPTLYLNQLAAGNWLQFDLVGSASNRDAVGAKIRVTLSGFAGGASEKTLTRWVEAGSGYAAQSAFPVHFGLGAAEEVAAVEITWPDGEVVRFGGDEIGINQALRVEQSGEVTVTSTPEGDAPQPAEATVASVGRVAASKAVETRGVALARTVGAESSAAGG
ncbi:MAG: ASPIC/UnbV domain-containing protein [Acidobacteriota bacterium]